MTPYHQSSFIIHHLTILLIFCIRNCIDTIATLKQLVEKQAAYQTEMKAVDLSVTRQRVILLGKELKDHQVLDGVGMEKDKVVQIFLKPEAHNVEVREPTPMAVTTLAGE